MPVELRKRKAPASVPEPPAAKKPSRVPKAAAKGKDVIKAKANKDSEAGVAAEPVAAAETAGANDAPATEPTVNGGVAPKPGKKAAPKPGDVIDLEGFGGVVHTHDGSEVTLKSLVEQSKGGLVLFTYPKASTGGCTKQVQAFRNSHVELTSTGLSIYGLSGDSQKANTNFHDKQNLTYPLLCDPNQNLISAIGFKKAPKSTTRAVFVIDKKGKVLVAEAGSPAGTVEVVMKLIETKTVDKESGETQKAERGAEKVSEEVTETEKGGVNGQSGEENRE